jgi:hypothetical protein
MDVKSDKITTQSPSMYMHLCIYGPAHSSTDVTTLQMRNLYFQYGTQLVEGDTKE